MRPFTFALLDSVNKQGQRALQPDGSSGISLSCDELQAPAQLTETSEMEKNWGCEEASHFEIEESSPAARHEASESCEPPSSPTRCMQTLTRYRECLSC